MLTVITGYGPRVGTSHIMRQAKVHGLDIKGTKYLHGTMPVEGNPGGYYDLTDREVLNLHTGVGKVWPRQMRLLRTVPDKMVVLERKNTDAWLESIDRQMVREGMSQFTADDILAITVPLMARCLEDFPGEIMKVATEDLDNKTKDILTFIGD